MEPRREVKVFADMMEYKLKKNDHKGNFENTDVDFLLKRLKEEVVELETAIKNESYFEVMLEAADVANFSCILVWNILRNQVVEQTPIKLKKVNMPSCDCNDRYHTYGCAIRVYYRQTCTCNALGELNKMHTMHCKISEGRVNV